MGRLRAHEVVDILLHGFYTRSSRHCFGMRQTAYFLRFFSKRWMMGVAPFTNFVPVICSYILIYRFDISSTMSAGASGSLSSLYGSECSLNHKRKNSLSKYSGSCPAFMRSA